MYCTCIRGQTYQNNIMYNNSIQEKYKKRPAHAEISISERNRRKESIIVQP